MNLSFEQILQITLRQDHASQPTRYIAHKDSLINTANINELMCERLASGTEIGGAVGYIAGCYKRLLLKLKDYSNDLQCEELNKCKTYLVCYLATTLEPSNVDLFGDNSKNALNDLYVYLSNDMTMSNEKEALMKDLAAEIKDENILHNLVEVLCTKCFDALNSF